MDLSDIKIESIVISPKKSKESIKQRCIRLNLAYDDKIKKRKNEGKEKMKVRKKYMIIMMNLIHFLML